MYLEFQKVRWRNFLSTGNYFNEIVLNKYPTSLLSGESGSGKSTFLDAVSFALFNVPFRNINKPSIINSINKKECVVEIEFKVGSKQYKVVRGMRPARFEIYCDGAMINQESHIRDYQQHLEKQILGFNYPVFTQIVVLGAANFVPFMQLKPAARRLVIEELLDMQIFSTMGDILKEKMVENKLKISELNSALVILKERKTIHEQYIQTLSKDNKSLIVENRKKILSTVNQIRTIVKQIRQKKKELQSVSDQVADESAIYSEITKHSSLYDQLTTTKRKLEKKCAFYETHDECPTCNQKIEEIFKLKETKKKKETLSKIGQGVSQIINRLTKLNKQKDDNNLIKERVDNIEQEIFQQQTTKQTYLTQIKNIKTENSKLNESHVGRLEEEQKKLENIDVDVNKNAQEEKDLKVYKQVQELALNILKDSGVKSRIIKQYLPIINKHINKYLSAMNFFVSFFIDENFNEQIKSRHRDDFSYGNFSDGEKQRIDLALLFTWRAVAQIKNSVNTNLLIIDELADSFLDQATTENVIELINSDVFKRLNIFIVSHKGTLRDKFHNVIDFVSLNNFSRIL